jgi:hypothetical protein
MLIGAGFRLARNVTNRAWLLLGWQLTARRALEAAR